MSRLRDLEECNVLASLLPFHSPPQGRSRNSSDWPVWRKWAWRALSAPASLQTTLCHVLSLAKQGQPHPHPPGALQLEVQAQPQAPWTPLQSLAFQTAVSVMMHFNLHLPEPLLSPPFSLPLSLSPLILILKGSRMLFPGPLQIPTLPLRLEIWCHIWHFLLPHSLQPLAH